jgi:hypothetical protein
VWVGDGVEGYPVPYAAEVAPGFEDFGSEARKTKLVEGVAAREACADDEGIESVVRIRKRRVGAWV